MRLFHLIHLLPDHLHLLDLGGDCASGSLVLSCHEAFSSGIEDALANTAKIAGARTGEASMKTSRLLYAATVNSTAKDPARSSSDSVMVVDMRLACRTRVSDLERCSKLTLMLIRLILADLRLELGANLLQELVQPPGAVARRSRHSAVARIHSHGERDRTVFKKKSGRARSCGGLITRLVLCLCGEEPRQAAD
jgi:hypothetical protein